MSSARQKREYRIKTIPADYFHYKQKVDAISETPADFCTNFLG